VSKLGFRVEPGFWHPSGFTWQARPLSILRASPCGAPPKPVEWPIGAGAGEPAFTASALGSDGLKSVERTERLCNFLPADPAWVRASSGRPRHRAVLWVTGRRCALLTLGGLPWCLSWREANRARHSREIVGAAARCGRRQGGSSGVGHARVRGSTAARAIRPSISSGIQKSPMGSYRAPGIEPATAASAASSLKPTHAPGDARSNVRPGCALRRPKRSFWSWRLHKGLHT